MSLSPTLSTTFTNTKLRTPNNICDLSGMCSVCSDKCTGLCEIGLSAIRGAEVAYPYNTNDQQFASEKKYPFDFSHFNINGRIFGAIGAAEDAEQTNVHVADISCEIGYVNKIKLKAPVILPAMAKLNWEDYYSGAAMAGVMVVIGENAINKDSDLKHDNKGKVIHAPILGKMIDCFRRFEKGYGDIVLQVNADDIVVGTAEYALKTFEIRTIEIKFGQAAKGIQHVAPVYSYDDAVSLKNKGYLVFPNPMEDGIKEAFDRGEGFHVMQYGRLPMWNESILEALIRKYRDLGAHNILFKMAGYDIEDIRRVIRIASKNNIALITFDGAGGGTGHSPCKMMNEWGYPTIDLEKIVNGIMKDIAKEGGWMPDIAIAGGIAMEDTMFKAIALGAPNIKMVGIGRGAMAAAMSAKNMAALIKAGKTPQTHLAFGTDADTIFKDAKYVKSIYKTADKPISYGAIGLYSYINRLSFGMKLLMTLNRKFGLQYIDQSDVIPLTKEAREYLSD
ncbi:MAG: hypothetical protein H6Q17_2342 [Bacteroidetes bacterium]|nr:hypothetical protein [Bacteroidota bacterium]